MDAPRTLEYLELRERRRKELSLRAALQSLRTRLPLPAALRSSTSHLAVSRSLPAFPFPQEWVGFLKFVTGVTDNG